MAGWAKLFIWTSKFFIWIYTEDIVLNISRGSCILQAHECLLGLYHIVNLFAKRY